MEKKPSYFHTEVERMHVEKRFYSFRLLTINRSTRVIAYGLIGLFALVLIAMFLPWQQNVRGQGYVTTLLPGERPQQVNTAIGGIIQRWQVREGQYVRRGDTLMVINEIKEKFFDPKLLDRTEQQVQAQNEANLSTQDKARALDNQIQALQDAMTFKQAQARNKVVQSQAKLQSDSLNFLVARQQFARYEELYAQGLISLTDYEKRRVKFQETQNYYEVAQQELENARIGLLGVRAEYMDKISKALSSRSEALGKLSEGQGKLAKLENEQSNLEIRAGFYIIRAPQDGLVVKTLKAGTGETIKEGDAICTIMPADYHQAVELYVSATDVPLLTPGRKVRLEFDGWPALQFSGWPSVSVGTFGGEIAVVDMVKSTNGKYRVLVKPDPQEDPWPRQLRIGSGVYGWAMLDEVRIWCEIWRQLTGFPPSLQMPMEYEQKDQKNMNGDAQKTK
ncbi:MAG: HlyD family secretion protein [Sphingobacteriia bacterium]